MSRFVSDASHELRTPIAALQATAETLLREQPRRPRRDALEAPPAGDAARMEGSSTICSASPDLMRRHRRDLHQWTSATWPRLA